MAFNNLMGNYYNGKPGKPDLTEKDLPANRLELFLTVLKLRFLSLIPLNALYIIAWLPCAAWTILNAMAIPTLAEKGAFGNLIATYVLILAPLMLLTGPSNMGISYVTRNWARDGQAEISSDFKDAFKANWKQGFLLSFLNAVVLLLSVNATLFYFQRPSDSILGYIPIAFIMIFTFFWDLCVMILPTMLVTYDQGFFAQLQNAFNITIAELPRAILIRLSTFFVPIVLIVITILFPSITSVSISIGTSLYIFLMPALNKLIIASFSNMVCEKYINPKIEGAETDIGLRPKH